MQREAFEALDRIDPLAPLKMRPGRRVIVSDTENFPTDLYMAEGLAKLLDQDYTLRLVTADDLKQALGADTAVLMLTQVNFRTGAIHDMAALTAAAHAAGALAIWDLSHSAGAVPVDLNGRRRISQSAAATNISMVGRGRRPSF